VSGCGQLAQGAANSVWVIAALISTLRVIVTDKTPRLESSQMTPEGQRGQAGWGLELHFCFGAGLQHTVDLNPLGMRERGSEFHNRSRWQGFAAQGGDQGRDEFGK